MGVLYLVGLAGKVVFQPVFLVQRIQVQHKESSATGSTTTPRAGNQTAFPVAVDSGGGAGSDHLSTGSHKTQARRAKRGAAEERRVG
jgi:hypothetical protein